MASPRPERDPERPVYVISVAASIVSVHPRTLRIYEDEGLVCPARTPTNIRLYSENDIRRVLWIRHLTQNLGVNLAGVRILFELEERLGTRILERLYDGVGQLAVTGLNPSSWAFNPSVEPYAYSPEHARQLLGSSQAALAQPLELAFNRVGDVTRVAERLQAQLKDNLGLQVALKPMEWAAFLNYIKSGEEHQLYLLGWTGGSDPDSVLFPLFHSRNFGAAGNRTFYSNGRVDELLSTAQVTIDQQERRQLYAEAQALIMADAPWLPIWLGVNSAVAGSHVQGYRIHPLNNQILTTVSVK